jgi:hypothetical protein
VLQFNFAEWLEIQEAVIQKDGEGKPFKLDLYFPNGELNPPVCRHTGIHFQGRGLICFDFDQTLTTAYFGHPKNPADKASHSTANPNPVMLRKMEQHKHAGNKVVIVTARGEKEGQLTGSPVHYAGLQPIITNDKTISNPYGQRRRDFDPTIKNDPRWGAITRSLDGPQHAYHLGAVSLSTKGESKGPFIATKMALFHSESRRNGGDDYTWGILYDDHHDNIANANAQQKRGIALVGIQVSQTYEKGGERPAGVAAMVGASGM